ncbi:MAG: MarR family transcriptional regulator [Anaerolineales bacterium]|nr:MarR family transcriptional regulator [Anaerolineales bacterium]
MKNQTEQQAAFLEQCTEDLILTIPRLAHCFRPHGTFQLGDGSSLSFGQGRLLRGIDCGQRTVSDLAEKSHVSLPTISRKIDWLVEKGLVSRQRDPGDRRTLVLEVTEEGRLKLKQMQSHAKLQLSQYLEALSEEELLQIRHGLQLLRKAFQISENDMDVCP